MSLICYNKGCGQKYEQEENHHDSCLFHPGVPIFHDALKGWSCCKKKTTDFSEFLSIKGCTRGRHSNEKPQEPLRPEVTSQRGDAKVNNNNNNKQEMIYQGPKSVEKMERERPSSEEPKMKLPHKVSLSLTQQLEKLETSQRIEDEQKESRTVVAGTRCKNPGCKTLYQGPETEKEVCTHHPGAPVFHEGYKYWSCCSITTTDFNAFLDQKGCTTGKHRWVPKQDKKKVACRHDWHQTGNTVVVTIYAKNANPEFSRIEANSTVLSCQIQFENDKIFKRDFHLWGVVKVQHSSVNMVPSKVEVCLSKADPVSWGKLEDPNYKPEPEPVENQSTSETSETSEALQTHWDIDDDDISDSDEEWTNDNQSKPERPQEEKKEQQQEKDRQNEQRKEVEEEIKRAMEERRRQEEERRKLEEQRMKEEEGEGYEDMPDLEDLP